MLKSQNLNTNLGTTGALAHSIAGKIKNGPLERDIFPDQFFQSLSTPSMTNIDNGRKPGNRMEKRRKL